MDAEKRIQQMADEAYRTFHARLIPACRLKLYGVRIPLLKKYAKELAGNDWKANLNAIHDNSYEEITLQGLIIGYAKADITEVQAALERFIPKIDNWATCDITCANLKCTNKHLTSMHAFICKYLTSEKEYELRFAVVMLLDYYITEAYIDHTLTLLSQVRHDGYYVKMAVAWALSVCYIKFPEKTEKYLEQGTLDTFTYNKTLQKICESSRVNKETKQFIKAKKRS